MLQRTQYNLIFMMFMVMNSTQTEATLKIIPMSCGLSNSPKIVGGAEAGINEFPWMAFILTMIANNPFMCAGSLLTNRHVITAAHCMIKAKVDGVAVFFEGVNPMVYGAVGMKATELHIHPNYNKSNMFDYDIAIITLNQSVKFTPKLHPICLPPSNLDYEGMTGTVLGWGRLAPGHQAETYASGGKLMKVNVPIMNNSACSEIYNQASVTITPRMLCAGKNGSDICMGDSGGPLMIFIKGRYHVIGIVSFGDYSSCGSAGIPGVYARVDAFSKFISGIIFVHKTY